VLTILEYYPAVGARCAADMCALLSPCTSLEDLNLPWCPTRLVPTVFALPHLRTVHVLLAAPDDDGVSTPVRFEHSAIEGLSVDKFQYAGALVVEFGRMPLLRELMMSGRLRAQPGSGWSASRLRSLGTDHLAEDADRLLDHTAADLRRLRVPYSARGAALATACSNPAEVSLHLRVRSRVSTPLVNSWRSGFATLAITCVNDDDDTDDDGGDEEDDEDVARVSPTVMSSICNAPIASSLAVLTVSSALDNWTPLTRLTALTRLDAHVPKWWHPISALAALPGLAQLHLHCERQDPRVPTSCGPSDVVRALSDTLSTLPPRVRITCYVGTSSAQYSATARPLVAADWTGE
jgi:hypothetical protein